MSDRSGWPGLPGRHHAFLDRALEILPAVEGIVGVAVGGSFITDQMDELSDLDFVLAVDPSAWPGMLARRVQIASSLGPLLEAFTGEHVGEPRLLICLYGPPLLHVDLKFVSLDDAHERVEDPVILWESEGRLSEAHARAEARYPLPDPHWIEARFWIWAHFGADKIERGEHLQALEYLAFLRARVLGPLALDLVGARPDNVRRIETASPAWARRLRETVARPEPESLCRAMEASIALYTDLRAARGEAATGSDVEREVRAYVAGLPERLAR